MTANHNGQTAPTTSAAWQALTAQEKYALVKHALHADHMSYGEAALALGASRVAIAGVVERSKRNPLGPIVSSIRPPTKGVKPKPRKKHAGLPFIVPPAPEPPAPDAVWLPLAGSHPVTIELHTDGCRWPINEARPFLYCNCQTKNGSVYCPVHSALGFREPPVTAKRKETA